VAGEGLVDSNLLLEALHGVLALKFLELSRSVLVQELVNGKVTTTNSDVNLVLVHLDRNLLATELVDTLRLAHEHDLQLLSIGVVIDVLGNTLVD